MGRTAEFSSRAVSDFMPDLASRVDYNRSDDEGFYKSAVKNDVIMYIYRCDNFADMTVINVTQARNDLFNIVNRVQDGEKVIITSKNCNAVLMSEEEYNSLMETLYLLSDPDMAADLEHSRKAPLSEMEVWKCQDTQ